MNGSSTPFRTSWSPDPVAAGRAVDRGLAERVLDECHTGCANTRPTAVPTIRASAILMTRFRSSRMCSMSDIRPSASAASAARTRALRTRAPLTVSPSLAMSGYEREPAQPAWVCCVSVTGAPLTLAASAAACLAWRSRICCWSTSTCGWFGWAARAGPASRLGLVLVVQVLHLGLQDAHRLAEGPRRVGQLLRAEEHNQHHGDDEDLPRTVEQVANHFRLFTGDGMSLAWITMGRAYTSYVRSAPRHGLVTARISGPGREIRVTRLGL